MTDMLRSINAGEADPSDKDALIEFLAVSSMGVVEGLNKLQPGISARAQATIDEQNKKKKLIPLNVN
jgi:hypothetical protein